MLDMNYKLVKRTTEVTEETGQCWIEFPDKTRLAAEVSRTTTKIVDFFEPVPEEKIIITLEYFESSLLT